MSAKQTATSEHLEHERLTSLINSMADAVVAVDEHAKIVMYNGAALNVFDVNTITVGKSVKSLLKPIDKDNQPIDIVAMIRDITVPITNRDLRLQYADGSFINLYLSIAPVRLGYGEQGQKGFVILLRDITREKSLEEERNEFISVVSHELRTPIAIAEGNVSNAEFIADKSGDIDAIKKALRDTHTQMIFLADMINDLSTLSRAERGKLELNIEPINVHDLVNDLAGNYTPQAEAKGLVIKTVLDPKLELLQTSKLYTREILQNFITNAVKYTEKGSVTIEAKADPKGVKFLVHDTGIGIAKGDQQRVFDKFFRSEDYRTRQASGTGLGLYVTMKLTRMLHADIDIESQLNKGSTFTIFIPNLG